MADRKAVLGATNLRSMMCDGKMYCGSEGERGDDGEN